GRFVQPVNLSVLMPITRLAFLEEQEVLTPALNRAGGEKKYGETPKPAPASTHDTCLGYYDVSGQYDKLFECNNTDHRYCCGTCYLRFCCEYKKDRLDQKACKNYHTPNWVQTAAPSPTPTGETYDLSMDQTNTAVYITCGIIAFIIVLGVSVKVAYDKATEPPQEMNIHRLSNIMVHHNFHSTCPRGCLVCSGGALTGDGIPSHFLSWLLCPPGDTV
uniref:Shisa family member 6 n=1 Tax=Echeneis naucrates TaxID=173247 RepID=A0A665X1Z6_ECHNA